MPHAVCHELKQRGLPSLNNALPRSLRVGVREYDTLLGDEHVGAWTCGCEPPHRHEVLTFVALYTATMSLPSTRADATPKAGPRAAIPSPLYWSCVGVEIE